MLVTCLLVGLLLSQPSSSWAYHRHLNGEDTESAAIQASDTFSTRASQADQRLSMLLCCPTAHLAPVHCMSFAKLADTGPGPRVCGSHFSTSCRSMHLRAAVLQRYRVRYGPSCPGLLPDRGSSAGQACWLTSAAGADSLIPYLEIYYCHVKARGWIPSLLLQVCCMNTCSPHITMTHSISTCGDLGLAIRCCIQKLSQIEEQSGT